MKSQEVLRELEELYKLERSISPDEIYSIVEKLDDETLKKNIKQTLVARGIASTSREAKSWRHLTARTSTSLAISEIRNHLREE